MMQECIQLLELNREPNVHLENWWAVKLDAVLNMSLPIRRGTLLPYSFQMVLKLAGHAHGQCPMLLEGKESAWRVVLKEISSIRIL